MLLITFIGLSDDMGGKDFVELDQCMKKAIVDAVGGKEKINEEEIKKFIPEPIVSPSYKGDKVFILIFGFYTEWMASGFLPDEIVKRSIINEIQLSAKNYLEKFNKNVKVQCSIS